MNLSGFVYGKGDFVRYNNPVIKVRDCAGVCPVFQVGGTAGMVRFG